MLQETLSVAVVVGTRPEIIKLSSVIKVLRKQRRFKVHFIHTGQHYDWNMSRVFLDEFDLVEPEIFLGVGSGNPPQQVARTITTLDDALSGKKVGGLIVLGDTNSAMAAALTASKLRIPLAHVEAGCRSFDLTMQEELNRRLISQCAALNFTPTENCNLNLVREGFADSRIIFTGHPILEVVKGVQKRIRANRTCTRLGVEPDHYIFATLHREENVDNRERLRSLVTSLAKVDSRIVFPIHPRTRRRLREFKLERFIHERNFITTPPMPYVDTLGLIKNAACVITDSGGVQQEAMMLGTPTLTARRTTEWIETVLMGANILVGTSRRRIVQNSKHILRDVSKLKRKLKTLRNPFGDGRATDRIARAVEVAFSAWSARKSEGTAYPWLPVPALAKSVELVSIRKVMQLPPYVYMVFDVNNRPRIVRAKKGVTPTIGVYGPLPLLRRFKPLL